MHLKQLIALISSFAGCRRGNFATIFALLAPMMLGLTGGVIDFFAYERQRDNMQNAADTVALAAANEATVQNWSAAAVQSVAESYVEANLSSGNASGAATYSVKAIPDEKTRTINVSISMDHHPYFFLGYFTGSPQISVSATAKLSGETPVCLLALEDKGDAAIKISGTTTISAKSCAAYSNSASTVGVEVSSGSSLDTAATCTAGGFKGSLSSYSPGPTVDCPLLPDPLAGRTLPIVGPCDYTDYVIKKGTETLNPGVYCGGISVGTKADVTLNPGVYIIKGGVLHMTKSGSLTGKGVTIYFTGADGRMVLDGTSTTELEAPTTGATAGLLLFQDPAMALTTYEISSKKASQLLGTIYLPNGTLLINANNKVAETSAFTVVVSRFVNLGGKTQLFLNSNYSATSVPVPNGLGPNAKPSLVH